MSATKMPYRRMGTSGLQLSVLSFGSWVTFQTQLDDTMALDCMQIAWEAGCNFFDNAEAYAGGKSEVIMGNALRQLGWERETYVISSKFFWGLHPDVPNMNNTLNRKYLIQAVDASLQRLGLDYLDLAYCHRHDDATPVEETAHAMHDVVERGKALYWGTSEWPAERIREAWEICDRYGWHKPVVEQPEYNLFHRDKVEREFATLYDTIGLGTTIWSPLASGLLTGKYGAGVPADSRARLKGYEWLRRSVTNKAAVAKVEALRPIAKDLDCTLAQLALAWCTLNPHVTTVITGASRPEQVRENFATLDVIPRLTPAIAARVEAITA